MDFRVEKHQTKGGRDGEKGKQGGGSLLVTGVHHLISTDKLA